MKKNLWSCLLLLGAVTAARPSHAQQGKWYMPPYHYDMSTASPTPAATTSNFNGAQSVYKPDGSLLFYINNTAVYSSSGTLTCYLPTYYSGDEYFGTAYQLGSLYPKMIVVPVPSVCDKYYVIYALYGPLGASSVFSAIINVSSGQPQLDPSGLTDVPQGSGFLWVPGGHKNPTRICTGGTFAVSKTINGINERYLFGYESGKLNKYKISATGINYASVTIDFANPFDNYYPPSIELSADQQYIATCPGSSDTKLYQAQLQANYEPNGSPVSTSLGYRPVGMQYDATSSYLFVTGGTAGVSWHSAANLSTGAFTTISGSSSYAGSSLEMGKTGNIYAIQQSPHSLAYISTTMPSPSITTTGITVNSTYGPNSGGWGLPGQIDGEDYSYFGSVPQSVTNYNVNGVPPGNTPPSFLNVYTCSDITLNNTSTGTPSYSYTLLIQSCDATGTALTGSGTLAYFVSMVHIPASTIDLKNLPYTSGAQTTWLADPAHIGYYKVSFKTHNECGNTTPYKVIYLKLNAPPSAATINLQINNGNTGIPCMNKTISTACPTGIYSGSYNIGAPGTTFGSNNIASYSRKIEEVDCSNGNVLSLLYEDAVPVTANGSGAATGLAFNAIPIGGTPGYFATHPVLGKCYKFTLTTYNACSNASDWSYFKIDGYYRPGPTGIDNKTANDYAVSVYPVPAEDLVNFEFTLKDAQSASVEIYDVQGRLQLREMNILKGAGKNQQSVNVSGLSSGLYIYKLHIGSEVITGRISKR
ncbi:T9SS type A sorting domain-containing protein [Taibaiella koreensis]|uniref:T9SS type A sorting domain-containing protein n=1 Tax=Taibaiella koreensis TaxID=1268548 RepID=UPI0013C317B3|nr:T9SS type A sorting domain-containing protein [Taibaiella koreensis]